MARVTGPLMSMSASGSIGKAITYSVWKGISYVRELVIPANPQSEDQGDNRQIVGGLARAASAVKSTSGYAGDLELLDIIPSGQSKQSFLVQKLKTLYMEDATAFEAIYTAFEAHAEKAAFTASAATIGLADLTIDYRGTTNIFSKGMMLYVLATLGIDLAFDGSPYDTAIASWTATETAELVAELAAV